jgi:hypothetical protein
LPIYIFEIIKKYKTRDYFGPTGVKLHAFKWEKITNFEELKKYFRERRQALNVRRAKIKIGGQPALVYDMPGHSWYRGLATIYKGYIIDIQGVTSGELVPGEEKINALSEIIVSSFVFED